MSFGRPSARSPRIELLNQRASTPGSSVAGILRPSSELRVLVFPQAQVYGGCVFALLLRLRKHPASTASTTSGRTERVQPPESGAWPSIHILSTVQRSSPRVQYRTPCLKSLDNSNCEPRRALRFL